MALGGALLGGLGSALGSGIFGSLFGGGGGDQPNESALFADFRKVLALGMDLYKKASGTGPDSLASQDKQALAEYQANALKQAQAELGAYDAAASAAGSPINQSDTAKERARMQIATGMATDVANKRYSQAESLTAREAALLPNPSSYAQGFSGAGQLDAANANQQSSLLNSILNLAGQIPGGGRTPYNYAPTWNPGSYASFQNSGIPAPNDPNLQLTGG
jgi:hypothetical protein